jgi:hypothetical protein
VADVAQEKTSEQTDNEEEDMIFIHERSLECPSGNARRGCCSLEDIKRAAVRE